MVTEYHLKIQTFPEFGCDTKKEKNLPLKAKVPDNQAWKACWKYIGISIPQSIDQ